MQIIQIYHKDPHGVFKFRSLRAHKHQTKHNTGAKVPLL
jgi:hypothetical protein